MIDLTEVEGNDATDHDKFDRLAAVAPELRATLARGIKSNSHRPTSTKQPSLAAPAPSSPCRSRCSAPLSRSSPINSAGSGSSELRHQ